MTGEGTRLGDGARPAHRVTLPPARGTMPAQWVIMSDVTHILTAIEGGDLQAASQLLPLVYQQLRHSAADLLAREKPGQTLQATALVHEAYLRLVGHADPGWHSRTHFYAAAAEAMRRILVDNARRKHALRHGGDQRRVELDDATLAIEPQSDDILALDEALSKLAKEDKAKAQFVELRYFAGLSLEESAVMLGISRATAARHWTYARAWLHNEIAGQDGHGTDRPE